MALLVRVARVAELPEGGKLVKETHGRKVLLARTRGKVYATDAHCYHMGGNLWEGDIEDIGGHACVVCPMHHYKIDMATGQKVDTMLDGCVTCSPGQQQRTYAVSEDGEFIWIDIPELHAQAALPSDRYNQVAPAAPAAMGATPGRANYGLLGASSSGGMARQPEGLAPYAGTHRGLLPGTPGRGLDDPALVLSQEGGLQLSQDAPQQQQQQPRFVPSFSQPQGQIPFAQSRVDTARIARRKAATEAIAKRMYQPPMAPVAPVAAPPAPPARTASGGQASLLNFGFTVQPRPAAAAGGPEDMDMS